MNTSLLLSVALLFFFVLETSAIRLNQDSESIAAPVEPPERLSSSNRTSCEWLFQEEFKWNDRSNHVQMGFLVLLTLPESQSDISNQQFSETQKTVEKVLETAGGWQLAGITARQMGQITICDIDAINGRTIAMKMVQLGLITPLKSQFSRNYLFTRQTIRLKDGRGNNLLHLAALSEDPTTVDFVLGICSVSGLMTQREVVELFEERNMDGKTAVEVAYSHPTPSLTLMHKLKHTYATTRLHAALQKAAADELGEPVVVVGPKPSP